MVAFLRGMLLVPWIRICEFIARIFAIEYVTYPQAGTQAEKNDTARNAMTMICRRALAAGIIGVIASMYALDATRAQGWPSKPVKIVVAFGAGGTADVLARMIASELSVPFNQQFYVENKPGNSGSIGSSQVARSAPDGYTLLVGGAGPHLVGPAINPNIGYDTMKDFTHIALIAGDTFMLAASPELGAKSLGDLIRLSKDKPIACGTPGAGSQGDLLQSLINREVGLKLTAVPYKGAAENMTDLLGGHIALALQPAISIAEQARAGKVIPIAVASDERNPAFRDVPTFAELGFPNVGGVAWFWLTGPKDIPADIVERLNRELRRIVQSPKVKDVFARDSLVTKDADVATTNKFLADEVAKWGKLAKQVGLTVQ